MTDRSYPTLGDADERTVETSNWPCHLHPDCDCYAAYVNGVLYHVIRNATRCTRYAIETYNQSPLADGNADFWERLTESAHDPPMMSTVYRSTKKYDPNFVKKIFKLFETINGRGERFIKYNTAEDMVRKHLVTDGRNRVVLCNKHLLIKPNTAQRSSSRSTAAAYQKKYQYVLTTWERRVLLALFPRNDKKIPLTTRAWADGVIESKKKRAAAAAAAASTGRDRFASRAR